MAFDRSERGHRLEHYPRRGESDRRIRHRSQTDREFYAQREDDDDDRRYMGSGESRQWRGHDYDSDDEFDRERGYEPYDRRRQGSLQAEHRDRFLRRGESDKLYSRSGDAPYEQWRGEDAPDQDRSAGPYAGRGPKGYRRSDERIHEDVCERLTEHPAVDASDIEVAVNDGDVTLTGRVESRSVKHLTEVMVETVSGVKEVHNQLRVARLAEREWSGPASEEPRETLPQKAVAPKTRRR
jgi:osmotically-inducible protein OsmY